MLDCRTVIWSVDAEIFIKFVDDSLVPTLQPFDGNNPSSVLVLDNASIHHVDDVIDRI